MMIAAQSNTMNTHSSDPHSPDPNGQKLPVVESNGLGVRFTLPGEVISMEGLGSCEPKNEP